LEQHVVQWSKEPSAIGSVQPEGFVVRRTHAIRGDCFSDNIAKYVRANHIQTDASWKRTWKKAKIGQPLPARPLRTLGDSPCTAVAAQVPNSQFAEVEAPEQAVGAPAPNEDARAEFNLPPAFAAWLCQALAMELEEADAAGVFATAEVILAKPVDLSDAFAEVQELLRGQDALQAADELVEQWHRACAS